MLHASRLIAIIAPGNVASQRVASKIGLVREKETRYGEDHHDVVIYAGVP